mmetsp:Transcript_907/g.2269  ORF Transcript_907/g.2269 Transcript_907/m.2269 type:complete len:97 (-) Transcript_907:230-520(-)
MFTLITLHVVHMRRSQPSFVAMEEVEAKSLDISKALRSASDAVVADQLTENKLQSKIYSERTAIEDIEETVRTTFLILQAFIMAGSWLLAAARFEG